MALSSPGIGSNLDVNAIVSQLMAVEQRPLTSLAQKEASFQAKLSAIGNLKGALSTFQSTVKSLSDVSKFQSFKVTSADSAIVTATGSSNATPGAYSLEISKLAQAQKLVSVGQASSSAVIGTGTITFDFGTISGGTFDSTTGKYTGASFASNGGGTKTVTIDTNNGSLSGIRDAINKAGIGVTAAIVNDGGTTPYRLVLTETATGKTNSMKISVTGDAALGNLLNHNPASATTAGQAFTETATAQNAEFKIDGVAVSKASNTVTDVIEGVTLNLVKSNVGTPTTVNVVRDTGAVTTAVNQFVQAYNQINKTLKDVSAFDASTKQAAILNGDSIVRSIQTQLRGLLGSELSNAGAFSNLSQIGVTLQKDGTMAVDSSKLQKAIDTNFSDIAGLFAAAGKGSDSLVSYTSASAKTVPGEYALNITQLATQGKLTGGAAVAGLTIDATNDTLKLKVDGVEVEIKLAQATYASAAALATELQSKINGATEFSSAGIGVKVTETGGVLTITSNRYGSASKVEFTGGNGRTNLGGATPVLATGLDVAGTLNGTVASGSGQVLTGAFGSPGEGLKLTVTGGTTGSRGVINFSRGYADQFNTLVDSLLGAEGLITSRTDGLNASLKNLATQKQRVADRLTVVEKRYRAQFTALDTLISNMNKTSNFLTQQLANLPTIE